MRAFLDARYYPDRGTAVLEQDDGDLAVTWIPAGFGDHERIDVGARSPWDDFERALGLVEARWLAGGDPGDELGRARLARERTTSYLLPRQAGPPPRRDRG